MKKFQHNSTRKSPLNNNAIDFSGLSFSLLNSFGQLIHSFFLQTCWQRCDGKHMRLYNMSLRNLQISRRRSEKDRPPESRAVHKVCTGRVTRKEECALCSDGSCSTPEQSPVSTLQEGPKSHSTQTNLSPRMSLFPGAAIQITTTWGLKNQELSSHGSGALKSEIKKPEGPLRPRALEDPSPSPPQLLVAPGVLGLWPHHFSLCLQGHTATSVCVCVFSPVS